MRRRSGLVLRCAKRIVQSTFFGSEVESHSCEYDSITKQGLRMGAGIRRPHASGRARQHFELFDSKLGRVKNVTTHNHILRVQYVR